jgi:hypothetical protein
MYNLGLQAKKFEIAHFILVSCDEDNTIDNQSWILIQVYVTKEGPNLIRPTKVVDGATTNNLTKIIVWSLNAFGGMNEMDVVNKLICFRTNG